MANDLFNGIKDAIEDFHKSLEQHLPVLEEEIDDIILSETEDKNMIESTLDTLVSLTDLGVGNDLFVKLLEYYKTIDTEGAQFYWNEYDKQVE
ncbi:MAG: hypothetical protein H0X62_14845 [Bacteroidetes bacterium]|nr:hypothetical protein [Bacteroidota bacterium]